MLRLTYDQLQTIYKHGQRVGSARNWADLVKTVHLSFKMVQVGLEMYNKCIFTITNIYYIHFDCFETLELGLKRLKSTKLKA